MNHTASIALFASASFLIGIAPRSHADDFKPEEGFTLLFNGKDLTGWNTTKGESLDGKTEAYAGRFKVAGGILTLDPSVKTGRPVSDWTCSAIRTDAAAHSDIVHWPRGRVVVERP